MASQTKKTTSKSDSSSKSARGAGKAGENKTARAAKNQENMEKLAAQKRLKDEICSVILIALGIFLVVSLQTSATGKVGDFIHSFLFGCFGFVAYVLPYYLIVYGILLFTKHTAHTGARSTLCLILMFLMLVLLNSSRFLENTETKSVLDVFAGMGEAYRQGIALKGGGVFGTLLGTFLINAVGIVGLWIFSLLIFFICALLVINTPISQFLDNWKLKRTAAKAKREEEEEAAERAEAEKQLEQQKQPLAAAPKTVAPPIFNQENMVKTEPIKEPERQASSFSIFESAAKAAASLGRYGSHKAPKYPANITPGQRKILDYMNDETLFDNSAEKGESVSHGLEAPYIPETGTGLPAEDLEEKLKITNSTAENSAQEPDLIPETDFESDVEPIDYPDTLGTAEESAIDKFDAGKSAVKDQTDDSDSGYSNVISLTDRREIRPADASRAKEDAPAAEKKKKEPVPELKDISSNGIMETPYHFPPIDLLNKVTTDQNLGEEAQLQAKAAKLEETLHNFGVNAKVIKVTKGPAVTRYEIHPNTGVKVSSIVRLADDIALNLEAKSIRMEAPIPGKAAVGIEVENDRVNMVSIREIVDSAAFRAAKSKISFAVGKDIAGNAIVADLKGMPHLLIAGSTGSGKSVCINTLIISILYHARPDEVKFVLIDPKVVELSNYNGIPHLLIPVVTDPSRAAAALNWAVAEMNDRYKKFADEGVRDLSGYNDAIREKGENDKFMPQIVIIIDELADLMMAAPSQVEESICRLAQMARAAGMHLIVATQRPSVDIITGVIKANIPSRIAFAVSSQVDSRTILDMSGAEKLVGKGDMLFNPLGMGKPLRVQGCFISDSEVHKVIEYLKNSGPETSYSSDVLNTIDRAQSDPAGSDDDGDELLSEAIETVVRAEQASVSMLQRRFRIGYNRAARLVDMMESRGIIGPADGSRPRKVLMSLEEWERSQNPQEEPETESEDNMPENEE